MESPISNSVKLTSEQYYNQEILPDLDDDAVSYAQLSLYKKVLVFLYTREFNNI